MLDSRFIVAYGLTEEEVDYLRECSEGMEFAVLMAGDYRDLMSIGHFFSVISPEKLDKEAFVLLSEYFREVDGNLTKVILVGPGISGFKETAHAESFDNFTDLKGKLPALLSKANKKAKSAENMIHTISNVMKVREFIKNHQKITTLDLAKAIDRNEAAIRRYIEILRIMGNQITYDPKKKTWKFPD